MSWDCPYQSDNDCNRLKKPCKPLSKGCVISGKARSVSGSGYIQKKFNVHIFQHVPFEDIGCMALFLQSKGANITYTRFFEKFELPELSGVDLLIIMGGPMSVNEVNIYPWLSAEKEFIRKAINSGVAVLGVCLGAQLIASALGSRVYRNQEKEIGWFNIKAAPFQEDSFRFPDILKVFHWHGETFDLPSGATRLASSPACKNQAFKFGDKVIGLQFHLEVRPESINLFLENCAGDITPGKYVQNRQELLNTETRYFDAINSVAKSILHYLLEEQEK